MEYVCGDGGISVVYNELKIPLGDYSNGKISRGVTAWRGMLTPDGENARVSSDGKGRYTVTSGEVEYRFDMETNAPVLIKNGDITITITNFRREIDKSSEGAG